MVQKVGLVRNARGFVEIMDSHHTTRLPTPVIAAKVLVAISPPLVLQAMFVSHPKLAYFVGLVIGGVAWYYLAPRGKVKHLLVLVSCAAVLGFIRLILN